MDLENITRCTGVSNRGLKQRSASRRSFILGNPLMDCSDAAKGWAGAMKGVSEVVTGVVPNSPSVDGVSAEQNDVPDWGKVADAWLPNRPAG